MTDIITIRGFVATDPKPSITKTGVQAVSFRIGSPLRRWDSNRNAMGTDHMNWFTVEAYRQLAGNLACSLKKGQKIIVVGKIRNRTWEREGQTHLAAEIEAVTVGHDLSYGSASYIRTSDTQPGYAGGSQPGGNQDFSGQGSIEAYDGPEDPDDPDNPEDPDEAAGGSGSGNSQTAVSSILMKDDDGKEIAVDPSTGEVSAPV